MQRNFIPVKELRAKTILYTYAYTVVCETLCDVGKHEANY